MISLYRASLLSVVTSTTLIAFPHQCVRLAVSLVERALRSEIDWLPFAVQLRVVTPPDRSRSSVLDMPISSYSAAYSQ